MYVFNNKYVARLSYYRIDNFMVAQSYQSPDELQLIYKTVNLDFTSNLMAMLVIPVQVGKVLSSNLTLTAYNERYKSNDWFGIAYDRNKWAGLFSVYNNIRISQKPDISVNVKAFYRTPTLFGIYDYTDNWGVDAGIKWQFAKEKAVLSFQCYDIFEKTYANMRVNYERLQTRRKRSGHITVWNPVAGKKDRRHQPETRTGLAAYPKGINPF